MSRTAMYYWAGPMLARRMETAITNTISTTCSHTSMFGFETSTERKRMNYWYGTVQRTRDIPSQYEIQIAREIASARYIYLTSKNHGFKIKTVFIFKNRGNTSMIRLSIHILFLTIGSFC